MRTDGRTDRHDEVNRILRTRLKIVNYLKSVFVFETVIDVLDVVACRMLLDALPGEQWARGYFTVACMSVCSLRGPRPPHCRGFMITLRHTTVGRIPVDE